ncbi:putative reverse transcriptase domain-containing protein [Tanacetum coccineum]
MVLAPGQPIPHGRLYRYHLIGLIHMMTARKRVGPLPTHRLVVRHSVDYSSSDHFSSDDSSSSSSSKTSSDSPTDALSNSASSRSSSDHSFLASPSGTRSSHRLCSLVPSVHRSSAISERPSHDSSSASRSCKRSRSPVASVPLSSPTLGALSYVQADLLPSPKRIRSPETATDLEDCSEDRFELYVPREVGLGVDFEDESSEQSRSRGANLVMDVDVMLLDRGIDARVVVEAVDQEESEMGTRGPVKVRVERVTHPVMPEDTPEPAQEGAVEVIEGARREQRHTIVRAEMAVTILTERVAELERDNMMLRGTMPNTRSGELRTREAVNEQSDRRVTEALRVRDAVRNLGPLMGDEVEQEEVGGNGNEGNRDGGNRDGGNRNGGNGNGNGNGGEYGYNFRGFVPARECAYQDFLKCQPLNFNGIEEVVGLTRWFEKMEMVFYISNCPEKYQVKMVPNEEDIVERFIGGLPDNIQGNVIARNLIRFQDVVRIANQLMDKKLQGYAARSAESKRRMESNSRDNHGQQPPFKRQNISWQNMVRAYTTGNNERRGYTGPYPLCNKCRYHHVGPCTVKCNNCKKDCLKLRNQNRGNQTRNKVGNKTRGNEVTAKAYAIGGGGTNPDSNAVTGTFLLNNCYASMLFDSGADRSFVSSTFSALLDITPSTLDTSYVVELTGGRISEINVVLRGCTLGLLGHLFDIDLMPVELGSFDVIIGMD